MGSGWVVATVPPEIGRFTSLAGGDGFTGWGTALDETSGDYYLAWARDLTTGQLTFARASQPLGFPSVLGSALVNGEIYAASFDEGTGRTTLLTVEVPSGVGTAVMDLPQDVRILALGEGGYPTPLYGASEPFGSIPTARLYAIDPEAGTAVAVMDLPAVVEALAGDPLWERGLVGGAGADVLAILVPALTTEPVAIDFDPSPPGHIVGMSIGFFPQPTITSSWGTLKGHFRSAGP
jgi:hypothetical protein